MMRQVRSCGVLVLRGNPVDSFLLMKHSRRYDLPKGHVDGNETDIECAMRELREETGIGSDDLELDPEFRWQTDYYVRYREFGGQLAHKTLVVFLGILKREVPIVVTEHQGHVWQPWNPPHKIQRETIDPLLTAAEAYLAKGNA